MPRPGIKSPALNGPPPDNNGGTIARLLHRLVEWKEWFVSGTVIIGAAVGATQYFATRVQLQAVDCNLHKMEERLSKRMASFSYSDQIASLQHEQDELQRGSAPGLDLSAHVDRIVTQRMALEEKRDGLNKELDLIDSERETRCFESLLYPAKPEVRE